MLISYDIELRSSCKTGAIVLDYRCQSENGFLHILQDIDSALKDVMWKKDRVIELKVKMDLVKGRD